ncbi:DUF488 domain-containing protein [Bifidobacterium bombi]|uniref:DUF488 family protein n=1 Tax=Bifidobacterium bombi DSM 19703 TaxID=1341695 RepID=A0A080N1Y5_9BIFI|nr:DUF488 domain-containing protein [Bifidobacterium bombi]KFF30897.1 hypothetical protein BBOMB_0216 [Bifidobacterium bombi DSM 19703]
MARITIKRVYDDASQSDGFRVLVDRLWPRGVSKVGAHVAVWLRDIAPSGALRTWFGHDPSKFDEFRRRYASELDAMDEAYVPEAGPVAELRGICREHDVVTLVYSAKDEEHNNAVVLRDYLLRMM